MSLFDATDVSTTGIEPGEYVAVLEDAEVRETKSGTGEYISAKWKLEESGSTFFALYNIKNDNAMAVKIGLGELKRMMKAAGREPKASGVDELIGLRCKIRVKIKEDDFGEKVVITGYKPAEKADVFA